MVIGDPLRGAPNPFHLAHSNRPNNQRLAVRAQVESSVGVYVKQLQNGLLDDETKAVADAAEFLLHDLLRWNDEANIVRTSV